MLTTTFASSSLLVTVERGVPASMWVPPRPAPGSAAPVVLHKIDTPTIASLNGGAAGHGLDIALGCDIRIAASTAKLSAAYTARTFTASGAKELGLVSQVHEPDDLPAAAVALASEVAANAPLAVRASKRLMRMAMSENLEDHIQRQYLAL
ncbi:MAG: hypothetical protein P8P85_04585, partial [Acidimicrobiales bacterium]|nr:hypothetical protein [Acidimicrobiales bacterium]